MKMLTNAEIDALRVDAVAQVNTEADVRAVAQRLVERAWALGLVLTVEQRPLQPLAMGHHETIVTVREARR